MTVLTCMDCGGEFHEVDVKKKDRAEFVRQYVLARAATVVDNFDGEASARTAHRVYDKFIGVS